MLCGKAVADCIHIRVKSLHLPQNDTSYIATSIRDVILSLSGKLTAAV